MIDGLVHTGSYSFYRFYGDFFLDIASENLIRLDIPLGPPGSFHLAKGWPFFVRPPLCQRS